MSLIEQLGGYERAKHEFEMIKEMKPIYPGEIETNNRLLLEYRRQHNIFEAGDKVVSINSAFIEYQGILNIDFIDKFNLMLSDDSKGFEVNAICGWSKIIRHATNAEIKAGKRL